MKEILKTYPRGQQNFLLPILRETQEQKSYIGLEDVVQIAGYVGVSTTKVYAVASFYPEFRFSPTGRYPVCVCRGTSCHLAGSGPALKNYSNVLGIRPGETDKAGLFSLHATGCQGACGHGPVIKLAGKLTDAISEEAIRATIKKMTDD
jgi:NADH:ubiquinone oxidoreductase subunit E